MINSWSLAYDVFNGTLDKEYPIMKKDVTVLEGYEHSPFYYEYDRNDPYRDDPFLDDTSMIGNPIPADAADDTISLHTGSAGESKDVITFGSTPFRSSYLPGGLGEDGVSFGLSGVAGTQWDDNKYYAEGYDPYPTTGSVEQYHFPPKPKVDLTSSATQKYGEDDGIKDLKDYVASTYSGHYTSTNNNVQTLDLIQSVGDAESFCRSNAIKYLSRYDTKGQAKRDILKAMHYCLLLYYFSGQTQEDLTTHGYETF